MSAQLQEWLQNLPSLLSHEFREIHINVLSPDYNEPGAWIKGAMACLKEAIAFTSLSPLEGIICAAFTLIGDEAYIGVNYRSCEELSGQFGLTPPSLYYFGASAIPWGNLDNLFRRVAVSDFPGDPDLWVLLHSEYLHDNEPEYRRSFWVAPRSATDNIDFEKASAS
jgi:hypothetical protein